MTSRAIVEADPFTDGWDINYQNFDGNTSAWSDEPQPFIAQALSAIKPLSTVIDLGAGDGRNTRPLVTAGHHVTALDISATALQLLAKRFGADRLPLPSPVIAPVEAIPVPSEYFDAAIAADVLPQVENIRAALDEIARILKPGGFLFADVFTPRDCAFGEGAQIAPGRFAYKGCLFTFFEAGDLDRICSELFDVVGVQHHTWWDPPHGAFRPYRHRHDALAYTLRKR